MTDANNWRELVRMAAAQLPDDALCSGMAETLREHAGGRPGKPICGCELYGGCRRALSEHQEWVSGVYAALVNLHDDRADAVGTAYDLIEQAIDALDNETEAA